MSNNTRSFPENFTWGFAAAAPQIEGAAFEDGKGASVWDHFARLPGRVQNGDNLDFACDHYHRFDEDFALMAALGAENYRLSIAWPRIFPDGDGGLNQAGLDFYRRLFESMEKHGLTPWVTMFHWDLPQSLEERFGGWRDRRTADAFAKYADTIVKAFSGQVKNWITLNEIFCFTTLGYESGIKAPGLQLDQRTVNQTYHTALLCHGHGVRAVREFGGPDARVGLTDNAITFVPTIETVANIQATRAAFVDANIRVLDPIYRGGYSGRYHELLGGDAAEYEERDFDLISLPTDFLGLNIYTARFVQEGKDGQPEVLKHPSSYPKASPNWLKLVPQALYWGPRCAAEEYGVKSIIITENGAGYLDEPPVDGGLHDLHRRDYVRNCLQELHRCIADGNPVDGYFLWSFMDNYEWEDGYAMRFGVVYNDFETQERTPKLSARWFSEVMAQNRLV